MIPCEKFQDRLTRLLVPSKRADPSGPEAEGQYETSDDLPEWVSYWQDYVPVEEDAGLDGLAF